MQNRESWDQDDDPEENPRPRARQLRTRDVALDLTNTEADILWKALDAYGSSLEAERDPKEAPVSSVAAKVADMGYDPGRRFSGSEVELMGEALVYAMDYLDDVFPPPADPAVARMLLREIESLRGKLMVARARANPHEVYSQALARDMRAALAELVEWNARVGRSVDDEWTVVRRVLDRARAAEQRAGVMPPEANPRDDPEAVYETTIQVDVLTRGPYDPADLEQVAYEIDRGDAVGEWGIERSKKLTDARAKGRLVEMGSEPGFFFGDEDQEANPHEVDGGMENPRAGRTEDRRTLANLLEDAWLPEMRASIRSREPGRLATTGGAVGMEAREVMP